MTTPSGPECYRRACDLLEQAFATKPLWTAESLRPSPPDYDGRLVPVLSESERTLYIQAAQAYATLAQAAALVDDRIISPLQQWGGHDIQMAHADWKEEVD